MATPSTPKKSTRGVFFLTLVFILLVVLFWNGLPLLRDQLLYANRLPATGAPPLEVVLPTQTEPLPPTPEAIRQVTVMVETTPNTPEDADVQGLIVFAMSDGAYTRLFAYHPERLPISRLTNNPWDDLHPALSPDGRRLAYTSRRNGYWDIYILDLQSRELTRVTDTPEYEGSPTWSPDGQWLAYETYANGNLDIDIQSIADPTQPPIRLTESPSAEHSPAWSPQGREIAFVSDRSGWDEIWTARLDQIGERFTNVSRGIGNPNHHPAWSPDGNLLAWDGKLNGADTVFVWDSRQPESLPAPVFAGQNPQWSPDGAALLTRQGDLNLDALAGFSYPSGKLSMPFTALPGSVHGMDWIGGQVNELLPNLLVDSPAQPPALYQEVVTLSPQSPAGRYGLAALPDVNVPNPYLHDRVDESFNALRAEIARQSGWDVLGNLENAYVPITEPPNPGSVDEWLLTGRAFAVNSLPVQAGWMTVTREERGGQTYWRLYVLARYQDGSQGMPLRARPWLLDARNSGNPRAYEQGGAYGEIPHGYWIDFTELAARFGWQPLPALLNWRTYYPAARFNQFVMTHGLDWNAAMAQFYPPEALSEPTRIPTLTLTPSLTPTIRFFRSATPQPSPTFTVQPTRRPTWTPLPGQTNP